ncbi:MAG: matrixin family metalloprotease [Halobacteriovoraceae bacterium]|nr:matrixin family metalloprotease [Halobacteriovoraceae bacterium]
MDYKKQVALLLMLLSTQVWSFTFNNSVGASFENDEVRVDVSNQTCSQLGITQSELLSLAGEAVNIYWNSVHTSRLELTKGSIVSTSSLFRTDPICSGSLNPCIPNPDLIVPSGILIACNTNAANFASTAVLALTVPNNISGDKLNGALILINDNASNQFAGKSREEKISILAHEIGHAIGLGHSPVDDSLMFHLSIDTRQALGWDDIDGVTYLYPSEQPLGGCGSIENQNSKSGFLIGLLLTFFLGSRIRSFKFQRPRIA